MRANDLPVFCTVQAVIDGSIFERFWDQILARPSGPFAFRFVLQPLMAIALAARAGVRDGRQGRPAYLWTAFTNKSSRKELIQDGWKDIARVFALAVVLDLVYQFVVFHWVYPFESLFIAFGLAILPYVIVRGPVDRLYRRLLRNRQAH